MYIHYDIKIYMYKYVRDINNVYYEIMIYI